MPNRRSARPRCLEGSPRAWSNSGRARIARLANWRRLETRQESCAHGWSRGGAAVGAVFECAEQARLDAQGLAPVLRGLDELVLQAGLLRVHVTVEAARLGEPQGKVLRGVANELRALAEQAAAQVAEGKALVRSLLAHMDDEARQLDKAKGQLDTLLPEAQAMRERIVRLKGTTDTHANAVESAATELASLEGAGPLQADWLDEAANAGRHIEAQAEGMRRIVQELGASARR